jgi:DNA-binding transcriptional regulator PaaX
VGGVFLEYCVDQGWMTRERKGGRTSYFMTEKSRKALRRCRIKA